MTTQANPYGDATTWVVSANTWYVKRFGIGDLIFFLSISFFRSVFLGSRCAIARIPTLTIYMSHDVFPCTDVHFGGPVIATPHLGDQIFQNPNFGGVNRLYQAYRAKYWNLYIIKTTASIPTKICTTLKTTKCSSWVVQICTQQIQDGDGCHFGKTLNRDISATVWPISMKFGNVTRIGPLQGTRR